MGSPTSGPYGVLKAAWHTDRIHTMRSGRQAVPISIQLILSDLCNNDCRWCAYRASDGLSVEQFGELQEDGTVNYNPNRMIPTPKAMEILEDASTLGVQSITFTGGGEPTVHRDHLAIFRRALDLGFECSLNTNGNLLRPGWDEVLPRFAYVRVSIDDATPEAYAKTRSVPARTYEKVLKHTAALVDACAETGCIVGTGYVVTPENYPDVELGVRNIRDTGAAYVRLASMQSVNGRAVYGEHWEPAREAVQKAKALSTGTFEVVDLFDAAMGRRMTDPFCGFQQLVLYIGANLKTYRCCYVSYTALGETGDLSSKRLTDWFSSPEKLRAYADFDARACLTCPLEEKNRVIGYLVDRKPTHVSFI